MSVSRLKKNKSNTSMTETSVDPFANNSVIADDDEPVIIDDGQRVYSRTIVRSKDKVPSPVNNEPVLVGNTT